MPDIVQNRFPRPEFEGNYTIPQVQVPVPRSDWWLAADVLVLAAALGLSILAIFKWKSRRAQVLIGAGSVAYFGFFRRGCICPVGSVQNVAQALADPLFVLPVLALLFFLLPLAAALWKGRAFCGSVCPFGALQELVHVRTIRVPPVVDAALRPLPAVYLATAVLAATTGIGYLICRIDPFVGVFRLSAPLVPALLGVLVFGAGLVVYRPYCRYVCPYGWLLGCASLLAAQPPRIGEAKCTQCGACARVCLADAIQVPGKRLAAERRPPWRTAASAAGFLAAGAAAGLSVGPFFAGLSAGAQLRAPVVRLAALMWGLFLGLVFFGYHHASVMRSARGESNRYQIMPNRCVHCGRCMTACPFPRAARKGEM